MVKSIAYILDYYIYWYSLIQNKIFYARLTGRSLIALVIHGGIIPAACQKCFKTGLSRL